MTTNPESLLAVTQEDREAAADYLIAAYPEAVRDPRVWKVREGKNDADPAVQAFARYRLTTRPAPPAQPGREEVVERICPFTANQAYECAAECTCEHEDFNRSRRLSAEPLLARQDVRPEAEPVAWLYEIQGTGVYRLYRTRYVSPQQVVEGWIETPLYTHPATPSTEPTGLREALEDIVSHRRAWRSALITARDFACEGSEDPQADRSYWNHELRAFDRTFAALSTLPTEPASVREERLLNALCLADELLMKARGSFPLPYDPDRDAYLIVRGFTGEDHAERKRRAALSTEEPKL